MFNDISELLGSKFSRLAYKFDGDKKRCRSETIFILC